MTLCIAWRYDSEIHFASDSRVTVGDKGTSDLGIKIAAIPVKIIAARDTTSGLARELFSADYGIAFSGSFLAGYFIREMLSEVLSNLQFCAEKDKMTIERIMDVVAAFHAFYTKELRESHTAGFDLDFIIGGKCPATEVVKVFRFITSEHEGPPKREEVLNSGRFAYTAIGAGEEKFRQLLESDLANPPCRVHYAAFRRLRDVINDPTIECVGGRIQCGYFENLNFKHFGIFEYDLEGSQPTSLPCIRGVAIDKVYNPTNYDDFYISYSFKAPFEADLKKLF